MKKIIALLKKNSLLLRIVAVIHNILFLNYRLNFSLKNRIVVKGVFLRGTRFKIIGRGNEVNIDPENRLNNCFIYIFGNNCKINIGKHCILTNTTLWVEDDFGSISIGGYSNSYGAHISATEGESIKIGEDCMFSHGIDIRNGDSHPIFDNNTGKRINMAAPIKIGSHVWLGADVKVLKGITIDDNSIIGTGSIVTSNVDSNSIYVGVPAKKVKDSISWKRHRQ
jgi:acetyltransferase-like isoleucine patch superfamily enzyme